MLDVHFPKQIYMRIISLGAFSKSQRPTTCTDYEVYSALRIEFVYSLLNITELTAL